MASRLDEWAFSFKEGKMKVKAMRPSVVKVAAAEGRM